MTGGRRVCVLSSSRPRVLVERHGITLDEAFDKLRTTSQQHNARVVEVAATIVGVAIPEADDDAVPVGGTGGRATAGIRGHVRDVKALRQQPYVRAGVVTAMMDAVAGSTRQGDEAAELLRDP